MHFDFTIPSVVDYLNFSSQWNKSPDSCKGSSAKILNEANGVDPGWVEIIPRNRVTVQVLTWLLSAQTKKKSLELEMNLSIITVNFIFISFTNKLIFQTWFKRE